METFWIVKGVVSLLVMIIVIVLLLSYQQIKGKGLLLSFAILSAVTMLGFLVLPPMYRYWGYFDRGVMQMVNSVMSLGSLAAIICLLGYVISIKDGNVEPVQASAGVSPEQVASVDRSNPSERILPGAIKNLILGIISFAIWYSYFNTSRRVEATYPDWKA